MVVAVVLFVRPSFAQTDSIPAEAKFEVDGSDTIYMVDVPDVYIFPTKKFDNKREYRQYQKLIRNLKKTYPYAVLARKKLEQINTHMLTLRTERERKEYTKLVEDSLRKQFEAELTKLTISQGKLLIKLVDRETGQSSYELVKELRGTFQAVFWQTVARFFGSSLKVKYDPQGEDKLTEELLIMIMQGEL